MVSPGRAVFVGEEAEGVEDDDERTPLVEPNGAGDDLDQGWLPPETNFCPLSDQSPAKCRWPWCSIRNGVANGFVPTPVTRVWEQAAWGDTTA